VHLKSLTLRGFKSFADPTTLEFEPGVTVVVGPNGSGKSNVVDAVAWVLGAQGPRVVRSAKMDDVIFAGTASRPPLGRAEVSLTIDNSSRRLPLDLAEVTITRTLFRTGESEYQMNGVPCRLLDIQEMLSDAGVGRQQHVIMGQGQLATVLDARPEDRRAIIEEAAGVLKFRRRRERAERRLESTEANLLRLQDLLREVRRQLRPLERQAEAARRHGAVAGELEALKRYLAGRELDSLQRRIDDNEGARAGLAAGEERLGAELARLDQVVAAGEEALSAEQESDAVPAHGLAERLAERTRGVANVVTERRRRVEAELAASAGTDVVSSLEAEAARLGRELAAAAEAQAALGPEQALLETAARELAAMEESFARRFSPAGPGEPAPQGGSLAARRARDAVAAERARAAEELARATARAEAAARQRAELEERELQLAARLEELAAGLAAVRAAQEAAEGRERIAAEAVTAAEQVARQASERSQGLQARSDALRQALDEASARAGVERLAGRAGVLGTLLDVVEIDPGCERAFEAAVEEALAAVVVDDPVEARRAIEHLRERGLTGAVLALGGPPAAPGTAALPPDALRRRVRGRSALVDELLDRLLARVVLCEGGIGAALDRAVASRDLVVVTAEGDRLSPSGWRLGAGRVGATRAALEAAEKEAVAAEETARAAGAAAEQARRAWAAARGEAADAGRAAASAAAEERQVRVEHEETARRRREMEAHVEELEARAGEAARHAERLEGELAASQAMLAVAEQAESAARDREAERSAARRELDAKARELASLRADFEVRAAGLAERIAVLAGRRDEIERRLAGLEAEREGAAERRRHHERRARALALLAGALARLAGELDAAVASLAAARRRHEEALSQLSSALAAARSERSSAERELAATRERLQRCELERAELRVRLETTLESIRRDLDVEPDQALAASCPELPPGIAPAARVRELERELRLLGPINPLAMEELAALEERDRFLSGQLEDVRTTRRDLNRVIAAVDEEIVSLFSEAFEDVSGHFAQLFSTLFPGGTGRLSLLEPDDPLSSGVEIEARPAGRNVRRLTLLSGGERSLVALAFLFAVFRSRPSPFYLMDEVEAALDDVNLHRFLDLVEEFRSEAQLVIVSHQKRTMESADVIYGVTMQPGGASKVVSERLRDALEEAAAPA